MVKLGVKRFYVRDDLGKDFDLIGAEHNHLANVLRTRHGETVIICCGDEFDYHYKADKITKHASHMKFISKEPNTKNPKVSLTVYLALIRAEKLSQVIAHLNEIGVSDLVLFSAEYSNISPKVIGVNRLNVIAEQSCKQCGRSKPMRIRYTADTLDFELIDLPCVLFADEKLRGEETTPADIKKIIENMPKMDEHAKSSIYSQNKNIPTAPAILIGPEGGFSPAEHDMLCSMRDIIPISMGARILRAETAAMVLSARVMAAYGELG